MEQEPPPDRGIERWKDETKGIERVISVVRTMDTPRSVDWVADEALVSDTAARDHLELLADLEVVESITMKGSSKYCLDQRYHRYLEVKHYIEEYSKDDLAGEAASIKSDIEEAGVRFEAENPDELRTRIAKKETTASEASELRKAASEWETLASRLSVIEEAIRYYESPECSEAGGQATA